MTRGLRRAHVVAWLVLTPAIAALVLAALASSPAWKDRNDTARAAEASADDAEGGPETRAGGMSPADEARGAREGVTR